MSNRNTKIRFEQIASIAPSDITANATNAATDGYVPTKATGADQWTWAANGGGASATRGTFDNGDLSSGVLTISHSLGLSAPYTLLIQIYDNNGNMITPDEVTGTTNSHTVDLTSYGTISGTWGYIYIG